MFQLQRNTHETIDAPTLWLWSESSLACTLSKSQFGKMLQVNSGRRERDVMIILNSEMLLPAHLFLSRSQFIPKVLTLSLCVHTVLFILASFRSFIYFFTKDSLLFFVLCSEIIYTNMTRKHEYGEFKQRNFYIFLCFCFQNVRSLASTFNRKEYILGFRFVFGLFAIPLSCMHSTGLILVCTNYFLWLLLLVFQCALIMILFLFGIFRRNSSNATFTYIFCVCSIPNTLNFGIK